MDEPTDYSNSGFDKFLSRGDTPNLGGSLDAPTSANNAVPFDRTQVSGVIGDVFRTTNTSQQGSSSGNTAIEGVWTLGNITFDGDNGRIVLNDGTNDRLIIGEQDAGF